MSKDTRDRREYFKAWRAANPAYEKAKWQIRKASPGYRERERARSAKRRATNAAKMNELAKARHAARMICDPEYRDGKARSALRWIKKNPAKRNAAVMQREAQKLRATPAWVDKDHIQAFYDVAYAYKVAFGIKYEVDHIVPLRSNLVCGLHVGDNLQLLDPYQNKAKGNRYWPDHPNG